MLSIISWKPQLLLLLLAILLVSIAEAFVIKTTTTIVPRNPIEGNSFGAVSIHNTGTRLAADVSAREALERTKQRLDQLGGTQRPLASSVDPRIEKRYREYLRFPANEIKRELKAHGLLTKGRKPDLAQRLAEFEYLEDHPDERFGSQDDENEAAQPTKYLDPKRSSSNSSNSDSTTKVLEAFAGVRLSAAAGAALGTANFQTPTSIQQKSLQRLSNGQSLVLHAETGSGKTLAYLLPITEALWKEELDEYTNDDDDDLRYGFIVTPTRELAAQVAGVASALAPPGAVRLVTKPTNLLSEGRYWKERRGDRVDDPDLLSDETNLRGRGAPPRIFVGSAKALLGSLYGDDKLPASPTRKPAAKELLSRTRWIVLDEVDRLLHAKSKKGLSTFQRNRRAKTKGSGEESTGPVHEKPAAILTAAVARRTLGRAQVIAASATVGRSLKRELSRVLGLPPKEYPKVVRGTTWDNTKVDADGYDLDDEPLSVEGQHVDRAITIPASVRNYVLPVDASSTGKLLTSAFFAIKNLHQQRRHEKILLVLTKGCGITTTNAIGALKHFGCQPEPRSLLDALQDANGTDQLMDVHRTVTGSDGIGQHDDTCTDGYLLVTGEDTVRGMHLAGLDTVVVVGRANGPDEYLHIAGRTGRAGNSGKVINVLSEAHAGAIQGWERMLNTEFAPLTMEQIAELE